MSGSMLSPPIPLASRIARTVSRAVGWGASLAATTSLAQFTHRGAHLPGAPLAQGYTPVTWRGRRSGNNQSGEMVRGPQLSSRFLILVDAPQARLGHGAGEPKPFDRHRLLQVEKADLPAVVVGQPAHRRFGEGAA